MNRRGENSDSIPNDLIVEIFSRLPAKSVARCRCLSKLWEYILHRPYFTELFLSRSWDRPRLLFALKRDGELSFYSSLQPHNPYDKSSGLLVANSAFHMKFPEYMCPEFHGFTSGLICLSSMRFSVKSKDTVLMICNPRTGQYVTLPNLVRYREGRSFLGVDPIGRQFKVLFMACANDHRILTLGNGILKWRKIICPSFYNVSDEGICINGVLYFLAQQLYDVKLACFDVRSEKFKFIEPEWNSPRSIKLINYKGKLGVVRCTAIKPFYEFDISVLEDVEKQEWSKYVYTFPEDKMAGPSRFAIAGVNATGEIVFSQTFTSGRFYVCYYNLERNTLQRVEIQGLENDSRVNVYVDLVEDLNVNDVKHLKSSPPLNVIRFRPKPRKPDKSSDLRNSAPSVENKQSKTLLHNKYDILANLD